LFSACGRSEWPGCRAGRAGFHGPASLLSWWSGSSSWSARCQVLQAGDGGQHARAVHAGVHQPGFYEADGESSMAGQREANRTLKRREPARSVANLPELASRAYRYRVRNLSPRNRNQGVQHLPGPRQSSIRAVQVPVTSPEPAHSARSTRAVGVRAAYLPGTVAATLASTRALRPTSASDNGGTVGFGTA
jgi:hypothetical protein